jgi:hypothetical protein
MCRRVRGRSRIGAWTTYRTIPTIQKTTNIIT